MHDPDDDLTSADREELLADTPLVRCHGCKRLLVVGRAQPDDACIPTLSCLHWLCRAVNPTGQRDEGKETP